MLSGESHPCTPKPAPLLPAVTPRPRHPHPTRRLPSRTACAYPPPRLDPIRLFTPPTASLTQSTSRSIHPSLGEQSGAEQLASDGGQGGGRAARGQQVLGAAAHRHGGAGVRGQGLQGAPAGAAVRARRAQVLVLLPRRHRRVHGHLPLPLRHHPHRHGLQRRHLQVRHRRHPGHRLVLRRHDLRPRLLHRRHLRRAHQPGGDLRAVPGSEAVADQSGVLHHHAVPGRHLRRRRGEGVPAGPVHGQRRRRQRGGARLHQGLRPRRGDHRHLRPRLHRLLRHRRQEERQGLPRSHPRPAANRVRRVPGAPGHHPHHRHRHQPGEEPRRRHHLQPGARLVRPLDLLGRALHRRCAGRRVPPGGDQSDPIQDQILSCCFCFLLQREMPIQRATCVGRLSPSHPCHRGTPICLPSLMYQ